MPGLHSTAGPPPPPPRAVFSIDSNMPVPPRPPRFHSPNASRTKDIESIKQALQLPPSVTAALASKTPKTSPTKLTAGGDDGEHSSDKQRSSGSSSLNHSKSIHRREGAFSPSGSNTSEEKDAPIATLSTPPQADSSSLPNATTMSTTDSTLAHDSAADESGDNVPPMTAFRPLRFSDEQQSQTPLKKDGGLTDVTNDSDLTPSRKRRTYGGSGSSSEYSNSSTSPSRRSSRHGSANSTMTDIPSSKTPSPPPKTGLNRTILSLSLKRFSALPRTPTSTASSKSARRTSITSTHYSSRTPSPSLQSLAPSRLPDLPPPFKKIRSQHPPAMFCAEVFARKTSMERCLLYAQKINELYVHDSGLEDWTFTFEARSRTTANRPSTGPASIGPQPRHSSRGSIVSEATFPIRPDAYTATDISTKEDDIAPASPINLPYPSLANQNLHPLKSSTSVGTGSGTPPSSIRSFTSSSPSLKSGGFFSSIGRKASMSASKKDKPLFSPTTPMSASAKLTKSPPGLVTRPINIPANPAIPGGPRAIPGSRPMRSQTLMIHTSTHERESVARRPSLADVNHSPVLDISPDPGFVEELDKLNHLLPHADRDVLAGYLRPTGQAILAIGQYLDDERNGTVRPL